MSMREYPCSGYVVAVTDLRKLLNEENGARLDQLLEESTDREEMSAFLYETLPDEIPDFDLFIPQDEDTVDEPMEYGVWYAIFDEDDLYEKKETPAHQQMKRLGLSPEFAQWCVWG